MSKRGGEIASDDPQKVRKTGIGAQDKEGTYSGIENPTDLQLLRQEMDDLRGEIAAVTDKIGQMCLSHGSVVTSLQFHSDYLETLSKKVTNIELDNKQRDVRIDECERKCKQQGNKLLTVAREVQSISRDAKSKNIVINGLSEKKGENPTKMAVKFLKHVTNGVSASDIENAYRLGSTGESKRPLLIKFKSIETKKLVMQKKASLKGVKGCKKVFCNEDLPDSERTVRQDFREIGRYAVKMGYKDVKVTGNKIQLEGKTYYERDLALLPKELHLENIKTRMIKGMLCFEGSSSYLSSSFPTPIKMNDNYFSSADQAFYYQKALFAGRTDYGKDILECDNPKSLKKMGIKIEQSDEWEEKQLRILTGIFILKFEQNSSLLDKLISTKDTPLLYCDTDEYWGTGRVLDSDEWDKTNDVPGRNIIGTILSNVRSRLMPAGGPDGPNVSPVALAAKKIEEIVDPLPSAREIAMSIKPTVIQMDDRAKVVEKEVDTEQQDGENSLGSIDDGGAMLRMLHNTMGNKSPTSTGNQQEPPETTNPKVGDPINQGSVSDKGGEQYEQYEKESICSEKSSASSSLLDLEENTSASIHSVSVTSEHLKGMDNITLNSSNTKEKLDNLPFPAVNVSKSLERSMRAMNADKVGTEPAGRDPRLIHSTPVSTVTSSRPARRSKRHVDEKSRTDALLKELNS